MRTSIDRSGRLTIPRALLDAIGLTTGEVEVVREGSSLRIQPVGTDLLAEEEGRLVVPSTGAPIDDDGVRSLRFADQH